MKKFFDTVTNANTGRAVAGATVSFLNGDGEAVITYADDSLGGASTSTTTDENGLYQRYVPDGTYTIRHVYGSVTIDVPGVEIYDDSEQEDTLDRAILVPEGEDGFTIPEVAARAGKFLQFGPDGTPTAAEGTGADEGLRTDLAGTGGAALIEYGGSTVKAGLDARPTSTTLATSAGSALVGFVQAGTGAVASTAQDKLRQIVSVKDFGAVGDGVTDATEAFQRAEEVAYGTGGMVVIPAGDYLISNNIEFRRDVYTTGVVRIFATRSSDVQTTIGVYFTRRTELRNVTFDYVNVYTTVPSGSEQVSSPVSFRNCSFITNFLQLGENGIISAGYEVADCVFANRGSRFNAAIIVKNCSNVSLERNSFQEYSYAVDISPTISLSTNNILIRNNKIAHCLRAINLVGTSMCRISNVALENNIVSDAVRNSDDSGGSGQIHAIYCCNLTIADNEITHRRPGIRLDSVLGCSITGNTISGHTQQANIRAIGCVDLTIKNNTLNNYTTSGGYCVLILPKGASKLYDSQKVLIQGNRLTGSTLGIKVEDADDVQVIGNQVTALSAISSNGLLWFTSGVTRGYYADNRFYAPSGTAVKNDAGGAVTSTASAQTNVATSVAATSVGAPTITATDAALNNAKSYVVTFTIGHASKMVHLIDDATPQTMTDWMSGVVGATLAWNASAWYTVDGKVPDIVQNGCVYDNFDTEFFGTATTRHAMMVIDRYNKLTCRDFHFSDSTQNAPNNLGAAQIAEHAYNTATFRPCLVVDGAIYDAVGVGLISDSQYNTELSGRMALGQKLDGTYVLLCVDGATGSSGCTIAQLAAKMLALGCHNAANLDGGGSTTLWYSGAVINSPSDPGGEREIPSVLYV